MSAAWSASLAQVLIWLRAPSSTGSPQTGIPSMIFIVVSFSLRVFGDGGLFVRGGISPLRSASVEMTGAGRVAIEKRGDALLRCGVKRSPATAAIGHGL